MTRRIFRFTFWALAILASAYFWGQASLWLMGGK